MKSRGKKSFLITIPIAAAASAYVWWIFVPETRKIHDLRQEMRRELEFMSTAPQIEARLQGVVARFDETDAYVRQHEPVSSDPAQIAKVLRQLAEITKAAGVQTTRFVPEPSTRMASLQCVRIRLGCRGTLAEVCKMLADIEEMPGGIWIDELSIEPGQDASTVQSELTLAIFANNPEKSG